MNRDAAIRLEAILRSVRTEISALTRYIEENVDHPCRQRLLQAVDSGMSRANAIAQALLEFHSDIEAANYSFPASEERER